MTDERLTVQCSLTYMSGSEIIGRDSKIHLAAHAMSTVLGDQA